MDSSEAYAVVRHMKVVMILSVAVTLLIGLAASTLIALFLVFPIRDLRRATTALAEGKREARVRTRSRQRWWDDEIGDLRLAFNRMAQQLMVNHDTLEKKVEERTMDLNRANSGLELEIKERRKVEGELKVAKDAAVAADVAKSEFLTNMSHEIRTPLNGIISGTELCLDTLLSEEQEEYLQLSLYSGKHLLRLITDILDFSKIEAGKLELEHIPFSIADQVRDLLCHTAAPLSCFLTSCCFLLAAGGGGVCGGHAGAGERAGAGVQRGPHPAPHPAGRPQPPLPDPRQPHGSAPPPHPPPTRSCARL